MTLNGPSADAYRSRREAILAKLQRAALYLPVTPEVTFANDVHYPYRQGTNLRYLTGFEEPAALLLGRYERPGTGTNAEASDGKDDDTADGPSDGTTLFVLPRDEQSETWTGRRSGLEGAVERYGADHAIDLKDLETHLLRVLRTLDTIFYESCGDEVRDGRFFRAVQQVNAERPRSGRAPLRVADARELLAPMRLRKSSEEASIMRRAAEISAAAHVRLIESVEPGWHEYQAQALVDYELRRAGCSGPAYGTIAAGGANATVLHYTRNEELLHDGDLLLVDAGGEFGGYCADITRTFPVGKTFSTGQAELYDLTLAAQQAAIDAAKPGAPMDSVHDAAVKVLCDGMATLGLLPGDGESIRKSGSYRTFYMHNTSHWLGMDVHDTGAYRNSEGSIPLEEGMVLTVEPGIYVRPDAEVPQRFRGIGIRIEDDVLVTSDGNDVLTRDVPTDRAEIEKLRSKHGG